MSKNVPLTDPSADELLRYAIDGPGLSANLRAEIRAALAVVVVPPASDLAAQVRTAAAAAGFDKVMFYVWDWTKDVAQFIQTIDNAQGPLGPNGVVVIAFRPLPVVIEGTGNVAVSEFPAGLGNARATSISNKPCDFARPFPWTRAAYNSGIQFMIDQNFNRALPNLHAADGWHFISVANRDEFGRPLAGAFSPEVRINATRPQLA